MTDGRLEIGDQHQFIRIEMKRTDAAGVGLIACYPVGDSFFIRAAITVRETDETSTRSACNLAARVGGPLLRYSISLHRAE